MGLRSRDWWGSSGWGGVWARGERKTFTVHSSRCANRQHWAWGLRDGRENLDNNRFVVDFLIGWNESDIVAMLFLYNFSTQFSHLKKLAGNVQVFQQGQCMNHTVHSTRRDIYLRVRLSLWLVPPNTSSREFSALLTESMTFSLTLQNLGNKDRSSGILFLLMLSAFGLYHCLQENGWGSARTLLPKWFYISRA